MKDNKKKKKNSVQELIGIDTFSKRGLKTRNGELVFFSISPRIYPFFQRKTFRQRSGI